MANDPQQPSLRVDFLQGNTVNLNTVLDGLFDATFLVDSQRQIQEWNVSAASLTGFSRDEVRHRRCADNILVHVDECGNELCRSNCPLQKTLTDGQIREVKVFLRHKQGYRVPVTVRTIPVRDSSSKIIGAIETFRHITDADHWKARISELERAAYLDGLTGIPNRRFVETQLDRLVREFAGTSKGLAVLIIDVDHFKSVNDTYGHDVGDHVICNISKTLMNSLRGRDILGRWGGMSLSCC